MAQEEEEEEGEEGTVEIKQEMQGEQQHQDPDKTVEEPGGLKRKAIEEESEAINASKRICVEGTRKRSDQVRARVDHDDLGLTYGVRIDVLCRGSRPA